MSGSIDRFKEAIWHLRQWLNEDRITNPRLMVTNEDIEYWMRHVKEYIAKLEISSAAGERLAEAMRHIAESPSDDFWDYGEMFDLVVERSETALAAYRDRIKSAYETN